MAEVNGRVDGWWRNLHPDDSMITREELRSPNPWLSRVATCSSRVIYALDTAFVLIGGTKTPHHLTGGFPFISPGTRNPVRSCPFPAITKMASHDLGLPAGETWRGRSGQKRKLRDSLTLRPSHRSCVLFWEFARLPGTGPPCFIRRIVARPVPVLACSNLVVSARHDRPL